MESNGGAGVVPAPAAIVALFAPTVVSLLVCCAFILPIKRWNMSYLLSAYGIHLHHPLSIQFFTAHMNHLLEYYMQQKFVLAESFHGCRFSAWIHCDIWVICIIFLCPHWFVIILLFFFILYSHVFPLRKACLYVSCET
ncbi:hypothetical protein HanRHA438_Chr01g0043481 [Helianthus annuus]|nr:hypothetical protein HanRHA438_Chr01g0043481 [Helianthus annuus]